MTWNTSASILARLQTFSSETAWSSLAEHFERPLHRYARRAGLTPEQAADAVQDTLVAFAQAYRAGGYDAARGRLSAWLFGIARREVASLRRAVARDPVGALDSVVERDTPEDEDALERIWDEEWRRAVLERCIERVRHEVEPATWECFALQTFEGLSAEAVAQRMGVPHTRVYNAKHRVSRRMRELAHEFNDA